MHHNYYLSPLAVAMALGLASPVKAAEPLPLNKTSFAQVKQNFALATQGIAVAKDSLSFISEHTDQNKTTHVRMQQVYAGFPVYGGYAVMHSPYKANTLLTAQSDVAMNGVIYKGLQSELGQPDPSFVKNADNALGQFKSKYANKDVSQEQVTPMVYIDNQHQAHWAYKVSILVRHDDKIPERPVAIIDAKTNNPFVQWNDIKTETKLVYGEGFGGNQRMGKHHHHLPHDSTSSLKDEIRHLPHLLITRNTETKTCSMENKGVKVIDMEHKYGTKSKAMTFSCPDQDPKKLEIYFTGKTADGLDEVNGAFSPTNDALHAGDVINKMYSEWYHINALNNPNGSQKQLVMRVHYGEKYENAYWDGDSMTYGDGGDFFHPLVSLGVAAHEISHGFTEQHSNLQYFGQSGGINESFSDMAAQAAEYYSYDENNWKIGWEIVKNGSGLDALRYMDKPSLDWDSIDNQCDYTPWLDVHYSSGVFNKLFHLIGTSPGWDTRKAFDVMVKANMDYWTPYCDFDECGEGVLQAIKDLKKSDVENKYPASAIEDVQHALFAVNIPVSTCPPPASNNG